MTTQWLHSLDEIDACLTSMRKQLGGLITDSDISLSWVEIVMISSIQCLIDAVELMREPIIQDK